MTSEEQVRRWAAGESIHMGDGDDSQCCPDFSCCQNEFATPQPERDAFLRAFLADDNKTMDAMLMIFLGKAMAAHGKDVYIAGDETTGMKAT